MNGTLTHHLIDANGATLDHLDSLVTKMATAEGIAEELKRRDPTALGVRMNTIRNRAEEIV